MRTPSLVAGWILAICFWGSEAHGWQSEPFRLIEPTGPHAVGAVALDWVDRSRKELATEDPEDHRQIVVQIWYPAPLGSSGKTAPYLPRKDAYRQTTDPETLEWFGRVQTNAVVDAELSDASERYPVLLLSHGWSGLRTSYGMLMEEVASHGYIAVGVDHPYMGEIALADGTITIPSENHLGSVVQVAEYYGQDQYFVLTKLAELDAEDPDGRFTGRIDTNRAAAAGHSSGFSAASQACALDDRFKACISFDAGVCGVVAADGLAQPCLLFRAQQGSYTDLFKRGPGVHPQGSIFPESFFKGNKSTFYQVTINGTHHSSCTDFTWLKATKSDVRESARRTVTAFRRYLVAFLDHTLKGKEAPLLEAGTSGLGVKVEVFPPGHLR